MTGSERPGRDYNPGPPPDNYLAWGIAATILCCLPLGIVSIVNSARVAKLWALGAQDGARAAASAARRWAVIAVVAGLVLYALGIALVVFVLGTFDDAPAS